MLGDKMSTAMVRRHRPLLLASVLPCLPCVLGQQSGKATRSLNDATACHLQVHPAKLTQALMSAAQEAAGAQLVIGTVTGISTAAGAVKGVKVVQQQQQGSAAGAEVELAADAVVLAMGPWTDAARAWLPTAPEMAGGHPQQLTPSMSLPLLLS